MDDADCEDENKWEEEDEGSVAGDGDSEREHMPSEVGWSEGNECGVKKETESTACENKVGESEWKEFCEGEEAEMLETDGFSKSWLIEISPESILIGNSEDDSFLTIFCRILSAWLLLLLLFLTSLLFMLWTNGYKSQSNKKITITNSFRLNPICQKMSY
jgi:hypothetical protein